MTLLLVHVTKLLTDENGATVAEYALMVALIATVCVTAITLVGQATNDLFDLVVQNWP